MNLKRIFKKRQIVNGEKLHAYCYNDEKLPNIAIIPEEYRDIKHILKYAQKNNLKVVVRGGGTNLTRMLDCKDDYILIDMKRLRKILNFERDAVRVQAGAVLRDVEKFLNEYELTLGQDIWSISAATVGGAISTNALGMFHPIMGRFGDSVVEMKVILSDGKILDIRRREPLQLHRLWIGSEGKLGILLEAKLKIRRMPKKYVTSSYGYRGFEEMYEHILSAHENYILPHSFIGFTLPSDYQYTFTEKFAKKFIGAVLFAYFEGESCKQFLRLFEKYHSKNLKLPAKYSKEWWNERYTYFEKYGGDSIEFYCEDVKKFYDTMKKKCDNFVHSVYNHPRIYVVASKKIDETLKKELLKDARRHAVCPSWVHGIGKTYYTFLTDNEKEILKKLKKSFDEKNILGEFHE